MYLENLFGELQEPGPCKSCGTEKRLAFDIKMAFQPIVDARSESIYGYEALVRSVDDAGAMEVMSALRPEDLYRFDQTCRVKAIETASRLGLRKRLSINFYPNAVYEPATCIRLTLQAAQRFGFPTSQLIFETAESEQVIDQAHLTRIYRDYKSRGFLTAIDDFGAGYAGLKMLTEFQPDILKIDMALVRGIEQDPIRQAIIGASMQIAHAMDALVIAEGVETEGEFRSLRSLGVDYFQGYLFGKPRLEELGAIDPALWEHLRTD